MIDAPYAKDVSPIRASNTPLATGKTCNSTCMPSKRLVQPNAAPLGWFYNRKTSPLLEDVYPPSQQRKIAKRPTAVRTGIASAETFDTSDCPPKGHSTEMSPEPTPQNVENIGHHTTPEKPPFECPAPKQRKIAKRPTVVNRCTHGNRFGRDFRYL